MQNVKVTTVGNAATAPDTGQFDKSYANPDLLAPDWSQFYNADPFNSQPPNMIGQDISKVDPLAGISTPNGPILEVQNIESDLLNLRAELPFLPVVKFPRNVFSVFLAANVAGDINVPTGAALVKFTGPGDWYVSSAGRAQVPSATMDPEQAAIYKPDSEWFYCGGIKQFSVVGPNAGTIVTARFIMRPSP